MSATPPLARTQVDALSGIDKRLQAMKIRHSLAVGVVAVFIVLGADSQSLSLVPLTTQLGAEYHFSAVQVSWALSAVLVVGAAVGPIMLRLGDRLGFRRLIIAGLIFSVIGNVITATSHFYPLFIAGRGLLGLSAAFPLVQALLRAKSKDEGGTNRGMTIVSIAIMLGVAISYLFSGVILDLGGNVSVVFWTMAALSFFTLFLAWLVMPDSEHRTVAPIDYLGALFLAVALVSLVLAIDQGNTWHWGSSRIIGLFAAAVAFFVGWWLWERRVKYPLVNIRLISNRMALPGFLAYGFVTSVPAVANLAVSTWIQMPKEVGFGFSGTVLQVAWVMVPTTVVALIISPFIAPFITKFGTRLSIILAASLIALEYIWFAYNHDQWWQYIVVNAVFGIGFGILNTAAYSQYIQAARPQHTAQFQAVNGVIGAAFAGVGPAIFVAMLTMKYLVIPNPKDAAHPTLVPSPDNWTPIYWVVAGFAILAVITGLIAKRSVFVGDDVPAGDQEGTVSADAV